MDATQPSDSAFLATHTPIRVRIHGRTDEDAILTEDQFLDRFMDKNVPHMHAMVVGPTGSGKSHLVRWVYERIRERAGPRIVYIPRAKVNLKQVIELIIEGETGGEFDEIRRELESAVYGVPPEVLRDRLIGHLAEAVGPQGPHSYAAWNDPEEEKDRQELMGEFPHLLTSPTFKGELVKKGGIIDQLVEHATGEGAATRIESPMGIEESDLPLAAGKINVQDLDRKAQTIFGDLQTQRKFRALAIRWLNENLASALRQLTGVGSRDLEQLMLKVRRRLYERGQDLVLLVEDFAKLQGVDGPLLEAALVQRRQGEDQLCRIRSLFAVTASYSIPKNVEERLSLYLDLDVDQETGQEKVTSRYLAAFASRYLNVLRLQHSAPGRLQKWNQGARQTSGPLPELESACLECGLRSGCHAAFGQVDGVGLYPFTERAFQRMYTLEIAQNPEYRNSDRFNPRTVVKDILTPVLRDRRNLIEAGRFPDQSLRHQFRADDMPPEDKMRLDRLPKSEQTRAFVELYAAGRLADPPPDPVREAFDLPALTTYPTGGGNGTSTVVVEPRKEPELKKEDEALQRKLDVLDQWSNGHTLPQWLTNDLRSVVYEAVDAAFPWNETSLSRTALKEIVFVRECLHFPPQETQTSKPVRLSILANETDDNERNVATIALKGVLRFRRFGNWDFEGGDVGYRYFACLVERLCAELEMKLKQLIPVNPTPAAVEAAVVSAQILGLIKSDSSLEEKYAQLFSAMPEDLTKILENCRSREWRELALNPETGLLQIFPGLREMIQAWSGAMKGAEKSPQVLDPELVLPALRRAFVGPWPQETDPGALPEFKFPRAARARIKNGLVAAIEAEYKLWSERYQRIQALLGDDVTGYDHEVFVETFEDTIAHARDLGVWKIPDEEDRQLSFYFIRFKKANMERLLAHEKVLIKATEPGERFAALADQQIAYDLKNVCEFLSRYDTALTHSTKFAQMQVDKVRGTSGTDAQVISDAKAALAELELIIQRLGAEHVLAG